jgi:outer membrane protein assembly factor BamB
MWRRAVAVGAFAAVGAVVGCTGGVPGGARTSDISLAANPNSVLSAIVSFDAPGAASAHVISTSANGAEVLATPEVPLQSGHGTIAVLGLAPSTTYTHAVIVSGTAGAQTLGSVVATTAPLPGPLAAVAMTVTNFTGSPEPGYFLVSGAGSAAFAVDAAGTVRWYRDFGANTEETKMQPDGSLTTYVGTSQGFQPVAGEFVRYTPAGDQIATCAAASPDPTEPGSPLVYTDPHEMLLTTDAQGVEAVHLIGYEMRPTGPSGTAVAWHVLLREDAIGTVEFRWKSWDWFTSPADYTDAIALPTDFDHMNSLAIDPSDGNYVASFRDLDAILKIDAQTGAVLWQLGGRLNQFTLVGDPLGPPSGQHSVRVLANGNLLLYDNGPNRQPQETRAVEYSLDTSAMTATLVWEFRHNPPIFTPYVGSVERLGNGNTLVAFGIAGIVDEVDPAGDVVWEGALSQGGQARSAYRVRRLPSLYGYEDP